MSSIFGKPDPKTNSEANNRFKAASEQLNMLAEGYSNLGFNSNKLNNLIENKIKSKIQIININENNRPYSSSKYNINVDYKNKEIIIICAQNSLNATRKEKGGDHFPEQFGKKLINEGFELFSKMDATPLRKRTKGGSSTSNVRTRIYMKKSVIQYLNNILNKEKNPKLNKLNYQINVNKLKKNRENLKKSYPIGNQRYFGLEGEIKYKNSRNLLPSQYFYTNKTKNISFSNQEKNNTLNNRLILIGYIDSKKYFENKQGIIKTKIILKYNECVYELNIINQGEGFYNTDLILRELNNNKFKNICASNTIICSPKTKITNKENYNNLKIKTNNIGKKPLEIDPMLLRIKELDEEKKKERGKNSLNNLNNNTKRLLNTVNNRNLNKELNQVNTGIPNLEVPKTYNKMNNFTRNDINSINKLIEKQQKFNNKNNFKKELKEALEKNKNLANKLAEELKAKYKKIENNTSINKREKITEKSKYIYIKQVLTNLGMNPLRTTLNKRGKKLENLSDRSAKMANAADNFAAAAKKLSNKTKERGIFGF